MVAVLVTLGWILLRQGPVIAVALLQLLVLAGLGRSVGLPLLFWRTTHGRPGEKAGARFLVGLAVGVLLGACCFVGSLSELTLSGGLPPAFYRAFTASALVAAAGLLALSVPRLHQGAHDGVARVVRKLTGSAPPSPAVAPVGGNPGTWTAWHLPAGAILGLFGLRAVVVLLTPRLPESLSRRPLVLLLLAGIPGRREHVLQLASVHVMATLLVSAGILSYLLLWAGNRLAHRSIYPAAAIDLLLVEVVAVSGFLSVRVRSGTSVVLLLAVLAYAMLNGRWQRARACGLNYGAQATIGPPAATALLADDEVLDRWSARQSGPRPVLLVVAASGGGIRSALWVASVLTSLEERRPSFAAHVRLIAGASGGMLGATYWASTLTAVGGHADERPLSAFDLLDRVQTGGLSAVASGLVFRDLWPPPLRRGPDRGTELERAWETNCPGLGAPVATLAAGEEAGWRPSVVLSPMVVEDGRRLVIANLDLRALIELNATTVESSECLSVSGTQAFSVWPGAAETLRLSTAIRLQASFPYVMPATEIPPFAAGDPLCRAVDAGYYDDAGVDLACAWIRRHFDWLRRRTGGVVLLQVRDATSIDRRQLPRVRRAALARGLDGLLTPVSAILRARDSTTWYRNDALVSDLSQRAEAVAGRGFFSTAIAEFGGEASLSWSLTDEEAASIRGYVADPGVRAVLDGLASRL
ncbi:MAG TPA: hypothetical protein VEQ10_12635 [Vicinamibacteria bacterium]|nr:hypothetical protein [Vicinamibacteria bacterium]